MFSFVMGQHRQRSKRDHQKGIRSMKCELCPKKAIIAERRGFAVRYMCGDCYLLTDDEFCEKEAKHTGSEGKPEIIKALPKSQLTLF